MWEKGSITRTGSEMQDAWRTLMAIEEKTIPRMRVSIPGRVMNREWIDALEVVNMLNVAKIILKAAMFRQESRGAHFRADFPEKNDEKWLKNTLIQKTSDGQIDCRQVSIETI